MSKVIKFVPRFPGVIEGHAINTIKKFYPTLCAEHEFDDLMQEAYIVFMRCKNKYQGTVDNPAWFMSLFSISLRNRLITLVGSCFRYISLEDITEADEPATDYDEGLLRCTLKELPSRIRRQIGIFLGDDLRAAGDAYRLLRKAYPDV